MDAATRPARGFSAGYYVAAMSKILATPGAFYRELPEARAHKNAFGFLMVSAVFSTAALIMTRPLENPVLAGGIYFINALGMTYIAAGLGYLLITMLTKHKILFGRIFSIYAFASGVSLLASWIPLFIWITEPWKWLLIGIGLSRAGGLGWRMSIGVVLVSVVIIMLFFWSLLPLIASIR